MSPLGYHFKGTILKKNIEERGIATQCVPFIGGHLKHIVKCMGLYPKVNPLLSPYRELELQIVNLMSVYIDSEPFLFTCTLQLIYSLQYVNYCMM